MSDYEVQKALRTLARNNYKFPEKVPVLITSGEYSDWHVTAVFLVDREKALAHKELENEYRARRESLRLKWWDSGRKESLRQVLTEMDELIRSTIRLSIIEMLKGLSPVGGLEFHPGDYDQPNGEGKFYCDIGLTPDEDTPQEHDYFNEWPL